MSESKYQISCQRSTVYLPFVLSHSTVKNDNMLFFEHMVQAIAWCNDAINMMASYIRGQKYIPDFFLDDTEFESLLNLKIRFEDNKFPQGFVNSVVYVPHIFQDLVNSFNNAYNQIVKYVIVTPLFLKVIPFAMLTHNMVNMALHRDSYYLYVVEKFVGLQSIKSTIKRGDPKCLIHLSDDMLLQCLPEIFENIVLKLPIKCYTYVHYSIDNHIQVMVCSFVKNAILDSIQFCNDLSRIVITYCFDI